MTTAGKTGAAATALSETLTSGLQRLAQQTYRMWRLADSASTWHRAASSRNCLELQGSLEGKVGRCGASNRAASGWKHPQVGRCISLEQALQRVHGLLRCLSPLCLSDDRLDGIVVRYYRATVQNVRAFGVFVRPDGHPQDALVHSNQVRRCHCDCSPSPQHA